MSPWVREPGQEDEPMLYRPSVQVPLLELAESLADRLGRPADYVAAEIEDRLQQTLAGADYARIYDDEAPSVGLPLALELASHLTYLRQHGLI